MSGLFLEGDLYVDRWVNGAKAGSFGPLNCTNLTVSKNSNLVDRLSRKRGTYGEALDTVAVPGPTEFGLTLDDLGENELAMALHGSAADTSQGAGSEAAAPVTAKLDKWVDLPHENYVSAGFTVQDETDTTTYVLDTDYEVNYRTGQIKALSTGSISEDEVLHLTADYNATSGFQVSAGTDSTMIITLLLDGQNKANGKDMTFKVPKGIIALNGDLQLVGGDSFAEAQFTGRAVLDPGESAPAYYDEKD